MKYILDSSNCLISNFGNVKNKKIGKILKHTVKSGYLCVRLIRINYKIYRLLAIEFIPNLENKENVKT